MGVYFATIFIVIIFCGAAQRYDFMFDGDISTERVYHTSNANFFFSIVTCWMIIVAGHRYYIGTDFGAYYTQYEIFAERAWNNLLNLNEPGFGLIAKLAMHIHNDGTTVLVCVSAVTIGLCMRTIKNNTDCLSSAVLLFLFLECWSGSFNAVRQCLAVAVVFTGYTYLKDGKLLRYATTVFIAFLCHKSAIIMILVYGLVRRKVSAKNIVILIIGTITVLYSYNFLFSFQSEVLNDGIIQYEYVTTSVNILRVLANIAPAVFFLVFRPRETNPTTDYFLNLLLIHASVAVASSNSTYLARTMMFTAPFVCIAIPELLKTIDGNTRQWIKPLMFGLFCVFWLYDISISSALNPFRFIWSVS